jgi:VCBS repeat-containing protein
MASSPIFTRFELDTDTTDLTALLKPVPSMSPEQRRRVRESAAGSMAQNFAMLSPLTLLAACGGGGGGVAPTPTPTPTPTPSAFTASADTGAITAGAAALTVATPGLLGNDTATGGTATVTGVVAGNSATTPTTGAATAIAGTLGSINIAANGSYTYTVANTTAVQALPGGGTATDVFTYGGTVGTASGRATVTITVTGVNDAPVARADTANASIGGATVTANVITGGTPDTDPDTGTTLIVNGVGAGTALTGTVGSAVVGSFGTLTLSSTGAYSYAPNATGVAGTDTFTYRISDQFAGTGGALTSTATLTFTVGVTPTLGSTVVLTGLNGTNGFSITGASAGTNEFGASVAVGSAFSGTGNSIVIGAPGTASGAGRVYVLTGTGSGGAATVSVASATQINGATAGDRAGKSVDIGDLNGGLADILIGAPGANGNQGTAYGVYGGAAPATALSAISSTTGFTTVGNGNGGNAFSGASTAGSQTGDNTGNLVKFLGSINGDANADFLVGLPGFDIGGQASGNDSGAAIVGYGTGGNLSNRGFTDFLSTTTVAGFVATIDNSALEENAVSSAASGNLNEASTAGTTRDLVIGAANFDFNPGGGGAVRVDAGQVNAIFSTTNPQGNVFDGAAINGTNGFRVGGAAAGDKLGTAVAAGDLNGDGIGDLVIGASGANAGAGAVYIVYGQTAAIANSGTIDLSTLTGNTGTISGATVAKINGLAGSQFGSALTVADFNGDGRADIAVGADGTGDAYIIYGRGATNMALVNIATPAAGNVVLVDGPAPSGTAYHLSLASGIVNSDGLADLVIGATAQGADGAVYVVYGAAAGGQVPASVAQAVLGDAPVSVDSIIDAYVAPSAQGSNGFGISVANPVMTAIDMLPMNDLHVHMNLA